jgi:hypothetical protein
MPNFSKLPLSQSNYGSSIVLTVSSLASTGTPCHIIPTSSTYTDEVWIYATNNLTADATLTLTFGGADALSGTDIIFAGVVEAYAGSTLIVPGLILQGNASSEKSIYGWTSVVSGINIFGYVNRIS